MDCRYLKLVIPFPIFLYSCNIAKLIINFQSSGKVLQLAHSLLTSTLLKERHIHTPQKLPSLFPLLYFHECDLEKTKLPSPTKKSQMRNMPLKGRSNRNSQGSRFPAQCVFHSTIFPQNTYCIY